MQSSDLYMGLIYQFMRYSKDIGTLMNSSFLLSLFLAFLIQIITFLGNNLFNML
jgi:hypothetical protein